MKEYTVSYTQSNDLQIIVKAKSKEEAIEKAHNELNKKTHEELTNESQRGYWEQWDTEENEM